MMYRLWGIVSWESTAYKSHSLAPLAGAPTMPGRCWAKQDKDEMKQKSGRNFCMIFAVLAAPAFAADTLVPEGTKATLSVDYVYESKGSHKSEGMYDPYQWQVKRTASLVANLSAQAATALPTMQALDAEQTAGLEAKTEQIQSAAQQFEPMMADIEKIMERCGEDEDCITQAVASMGMGMAGTPEMDAAMAAGEQAKAASQPDAVRYQAWRPTAQKGTYLIDETVHISSTDPICVELPGNRCTRDEVRKGSGEIPVPTGTDDDAGARAGLSGLEIDSSKSSFVLTLPVPFLPLPYTETITTDEPEGTHDTPTPKGPQQKLLSFRVSDKGGVMQEEPYTVAIKGNWRGQSGEQVIDLPGNFGDGGKLIVRWKFKVL